MESYGGHRLRGAVILLAVLVSGCPSQAPTPDDDTSGEAPSGREVALGAPTPAFPGSPAGSAASLSEEAEAAFVPGSPAGGVPAWAEGFEGAIAGLDGELYEGYRAATIEHVQETLRRRGLYAGPVNGILDAPTMEAIYAFQDASYGLQRCGVPTPRTRLLLERGSHT